MIMRSSLRALAAASIATAMALATASGASAACKGHNHSATGSANGIQFLASVSAKNAWKSVVAAHDGGAWDTWGKASNKSVNCRKSGEGSAWVCTARAKPCN